MKRYDQRRPVPTGPSANLCQKFIQRGVGIAMGTAKGDDMLVHKGADAVVDVKLCDQCVAEVRE